MSSVISCNWRDFAVHVKSSNKRIISLALILYFALFNQAEAAQVKLKVAATIFPLADIAKQVAGNNAEIITILPPGANPHTFELVPKTIKQLEGASVIFVVGHTFDHWVEAVGESIQGIKVIPVDSHIDLIRSENAVADPHYWLSITNAKQIALNIAQALTDFDPHGKSQYQENLQVYLSKLDETDRKIKALFSGLSSREIITYHNGWQYFARDYGFKIVGNVESSQGSEPTPARFRELSKTISKHKVKVLFSEPAVSRRLAESLARDFGLRLYELDPFGGSDGKMDFLTLMAANAHVMHEALKHE